MSVGFALAAAIVSILTMVFIGLKWNINLRSSIPNSMLVSIAISLPFIYVYDHLHTGWYSLIGMVIQISISHLVAIILLLIHFWRDPERSSPEQKGIIVSPADGKIIYIKYIYDSSTPLVTKSDHEYSLSELTGTELSGRRMVVIGIEMNILDVHINRCPIEGHVKLVKNTHGRYLSLRRDEAPFLNARCTTLIENGTLSIAIIQIASRLVRKVDNYLTSGQTVSLGQRLGMIRFGSLVALIFPQTDEIQIETRIGQKVEAGTSILANYYGWEKTT